MDYYNANTIQVQKENFAPTLRSPMHMSHPPHVPHKSSLS